MDEEPRAAVAIITVGDAGDILLVRRADNPQDPWAGHWALPGGRREPGETLLETCIRECHEECSIQLEPDELRERLPVAYAGRAMNRPLPVLPLHWHFNEQPDIRLDYTELQSHSFLSPDAFRHWNRHSSGRLAVAYPEREYPYYEFKGVPLWGFTYQVLCQWLQSK